MQTKRVDKTELYTTAKHIAEVLRTGCPKDATCAVCTHDCMAMDIAQQVVAYGYKRINKKAKKSTMQCKTMRAFIEEMAKDIALVRGYGCNSQDCCEKCSCAKVVGCVPFDIAEYLIMQGYRKEDIK